MLRTRARPALFGAGAAASGGVSDDSFLTEDASPARDAALDWAAAFGRGGRTDEMRLQLELDLRRDALVQVSDLVVKLDSEEWLFDYPRHKRTMMRGGGRRS